MQEAPMKDTSTAGRLPRVKAAPSSTSLVLQGEAANASEIVQNWHDTEHPDPWAVCTKQPCHAIQTAAI